MTVGMGWEGGSRFFNCVPVVLVLSTLMEGIFGYCCGCFSI